MARKCSEFDQAPEWSGRLIKAPETAVVLSAAQWDERTVCHYGHGVESKDPYALQEVWCFSFSLNWDTISSWPAGKHRELNKVHALQWL